MIDKDFYKNHGPLKLRYLAEQIDAEFEGDDEFEIKDIATLKLANSNEISFFHSAKYKEDFEKTNAGCIIISKDFKLKNTLVKNFIYSDNPYLTMAKVASIFYPNCEYPSFFFNSEVKLDKYDSSKFSSNIQIGDSCQIGKNCDIGSFVKIGHGVKIGDNCIIGDNVNIYYSIISNNVKIYNGVKIGSEGFGFIPGKDTIKKIPQLGRVIIEENVEIGVNSAIDRGSIGDTKISKNTMIDNLVHIAHNVKIGSNCIIAGMTGISGSTEIGDNVMIGGQVGISGHLKIGDNVKIAAKSGIMKNIPNNTSVGGYPATNIIDWHRSTLMGRKK